MRDNKKSDVASSGGGKWEKAAKHSQDDDSADDGPAPTKGRWGILKKR